MLRKTAVFLQQEANLASRTFSAVEKIKNILMEELLTASTHPLISASCKYHSPLPRRHGPGGRSASQSPLCSETLVPEWCYCLPTWRLHGNVRWLLGQYPEAYSGDQGPTNQSLTITCICPLQVREVCSYTVEEWYRSCTLYFPCGTAKKLKSAFPIVSTLD